MNPASNGLNRLLLAASLGFSLVAAHAAMANDTLREQSHKVVEARGLRGVRVSNARGRVSVRPSPDARIHLTALKIARARDREHSMRIARETEVTTANEEGLLVVRVRYPQRQTFRVSFWEFFAGCEWPKVEVRLELEVPAGTPVWLHSTSGDLATEALTGPQNLETTSGDVSVSVAGGTVVATSTSGDIAAAGVGSARLRTVSGDLEVEGVQGPLRARSTSGGITVTGAEDSLSLVTVSGDIEVAAAPRGLSAESTSGAIVARSASGDVRLETVSGDVDVGLDGRLRRVEVATTSGEIGVRLLGSVGCALEMRTASGSLDASVPLTVETVSRRIVSGLVRGGGAPVKLRSSSGDIKVRNGGS